MYVYIYFQVYKYQIRIYFALAWAVDVLWCPVLIRMGITASTIPRQLLR